MDSPDPRSAVVSRLIAVLRKVTRIVQLLPFAYLLLLSLKLFLEPVLPEWALDVTDNMAVSFVPSTIALLFLGRVLKLCVWFRTACILPIATRIESWVDSFVVTFTQGEVIIINAAIGILFLLFIYLAIRHFFHGRRDKHQERATGNPAIL